MGITNLFGRLRFAKALVQSRTLAAKCINENLEAPNESLAQYEACNQFITWSLALPRDVYATQVRMATNLSNIDDWVRFDSCLQYAKGKRKLRTAIFVDENLKDGIGRFLVSTVGSMTSLSSKLMKRPRNDLDLMSAATFAYVASHVFSEYPSAWLLLADLSARGIRYPGDNRDHITEGVLHISRLRELDLPSEFAFQTDGAIRVLQSLKHNL